MRRMSLFLTTCLFCYQNNYTANMYVKLPTQIKIEQTFAKYRLQNLEQKLHIGLLNQHKNYSIAGLSYQTILWCSVYEKYSKKNDLNKLQTTCAQSIAELIRTKHAYAAYHYKYIMGKIAEINELPTMLYQLENELGIMHAIAHKRSKKRTNPPQAPRATTPRIRRCHSIG